jgi:hypothetical protein
MKRAFCHAVTRPVCLLGLCTAAGIVGCSRPAEPTAQVQLSVEMPDGDPGRLSDAPITPPDLREVDGDGSDVKFRVGDAQLTQKSGGTATGKSPAEDAEALPKGVEGPEDYRTWERPEIALVVTGQQHGYIEPCGCTGLERQKGGMARRFTFMKQLREKGWNLVPVDAGNQVRRFGQQPAIKLQQSVKALQAMNYRAVGFGPDDIRLGVGDLLAVAAGDDDSMFASANVVLIDPTLMPKTKVIETEGRKIGVTSVLDPDALGDVPKNDEILIEPMKEATRTALDELKAASSDFKVLLYFGKEEAGQQLVRDVPGFDLLVAAGGYGEPTFRAEPIKDSKTRMIVTGSKGMYAGLVGVYPDKSIKYARVPLTHEFKDAPEMRQLMKEYQDQLRDIGLDGLGLLPPIPHLSGYKFVGSEKCGECHTTAYEIWQGTPHAEATEHIVHPPEERGDVARHFDPECITCHVTGWNNVEFYPYESGYLSLEASGHLTGSGCENCHGPGSEHVAAETDGAADEILTKFRDAMRLPLEKAREKCMECHDLDNSPDFHETDAFEDIYWPEVEHYGLD